MLAVAIRARFQTVQSTSAPAGVRAVTVAILAIVMTCRDRHDNADKRRVPSLARPNIDCEKRTNASLHVGQSSAAWLHVGFPTFVFGSGRDRRQPGSNRPCNYRTAR